MKKVILMMAVVMAMAIMFTACGSSSEKSHNGHLRGSVKTDMFDGSLGSFK